jgi:hypothetical protein
MVARRGGESFKSNQSIDIIMPYYKQKQNGKNTNSSIEANIFPKLLGNCNITPFDKEYL